MDQSHKIVAELIKIAEHADAFRHGSEEFYGLLNLTEVHCIHWIGTLDHANVTKVSNEMGMTRGAISKICKKLLHRQLIESYQEPENNKNIYFRVAESGRSIFEAHKITHTRTFEEKVNIANKYDADEQAIILRFLMDINAFVENSLETAYADSCDNEE